MTGSVSTCLSWSTDRQLLSQHYSVTGCPTSTGLTEVEQNHRH